METGRTVDESVCSMCEGKIPHHNTTHTQTHSAGCIRRAPATVGEKKRMFCVQHILLRAPALCRTAVLCRYIICIYFSRSSLYTGAWLQRETTGMPEVIVFTFVFCFASSCKQDALCMFAHYSFWRRIRLLETRVSPSSNPPTHSHFGPTAGGTKKHMLSRVPRTLILLMQS